MSKHASSTAETVADPRWAAVIARNTDGDGQFFYSVKTTGVFCRPSCAARTPLPENVAFHATAEAAQAAGFRACLRCQPTAASLAQRHSELVARICRYIDACDTLPTLVELAAVAGASPHHLHRLFKRVTGVTPAVYARDARHRRLRQALRDEASVTGAIHAAGYGSQARFYAVADDVLGMTPREYRQGGPDTVVRHALARCSMGVILVAASARGICHIAIDDDPTALMAALQRRFPKASLAAGGSNFDAMVAQVVAFVEAPATGLALPLDLRGTTFQLRVWQALCAVPPGQAVSYTEIARRIGAPRAVRAVATACAANTLAVVIPCHRVVRSDGSLSGYRWGIARKRRLLNIERQAAAAPPAVTVRSEDGAARSTDAGNDPGDRGAADHHRR